MKARAVDTDRLHLWLMLCLTFSTGVVDAIGYLGLDRVFTGNMTGNVVLLGMGIVGAEELPVLRPALALVCFMIGAGCAGRGLRNCPVGWSKGTSLALLCVASLAGVLAVFFAVVDHTSHSVYGSVATSTLGFIMGIQAATARRLKVAEITTVVVTSTITGFAAESKPAGGTSPYWARRALAILLILLGAAAGAAALSLGLWFGLAVSAALTAAVTVVGHIRYRSDKRLARAENTPGLASSSMQR